MAPLADQCIYTAMQVETDHDLHARPSSSPGDRKLGKVGQQSKYRSVYHGIENEFFLAALHKGEKNTRVSIDLVPGAGNLSYRVAPHSTQPHLPIDMSVPPSLVIHGLLNHTSADKDVEPGLRVHFESWSRSLCHRCASSGPG